MAPYLDCTVVYKPLATIKEYTLTQWKYLQACYGGLWGVICRFIRSSRAATLVPAFVHAVVDRLTVNRVKTREVLTVEPR